MSRARISRPAIAVHQASLRNLLPRRGPVARSVPRTSAFPEHRRERGRPPLPPAPSHRPPHRSRRVEQAAPTPDLSSPTRSSERRRIRRRGRGAHRGSRSFTADDRSHRSGLRTVRRRDRTRASQPRARSSRDFRPFPACFRKRCGAPIDRMIPRSALDGPCHREPCYHSLGGIRAGAISGSMTRVTPCDAAIRGA